MVIFMMIFENKEVFYMEECYDYFNCRESNCCKYNKKDNPCWECDTNLCKTHNEAMIFLRNDFENKNDACKLCLYYKQFNNY